MKRPRLLFVWCALAPTVACAQDVRVRLYTNHPPEALFVRGIDRDFQWRPCPTCGDTLTRELKVEGKAENLSDGNSGKDFYITGNYQLRPASGPSFAADSPTHIESRDGHLLVTVTMPLEEYVADVLMAESGGFENTESQKAMAVVARTYAMHFMGQHTKEGFDFCDTTHCQVLGWKGAKAAVQSAVNATRGEVLRYAGQLAAAYYHQNCGGTTATAGETWPGVQEPYLVAHPDTYCAARGAMLWETTLHVEEIERALRESALTTPKGWRTVEVVQRSESGRALRLKLTGGSGGNPFVTGSTFRFAVNRQLGWQKIRSTLFEVRNAGGDVVFSGRGSGHGVGLCQAGAEEMAREGKSYREILSFYYPGTEVSGLETANEAHWQTRRSDHIELLSTQPEGDAAILPMAERVLKQDEEVIGWAATAGVQLRIYPTLDAYRDNAGEPGWVAASTRGHTIRLQPLRELGKRGIVESTLRHEILHVLVEAKAKASTPLWFREGIVLFLSNAYAPHATANGMTDEQVEEVLRQPRDRAKVQEAYLAAHNRVAGLVQQHGKEAVLGWLSGGIPGEVLGGASSESVVTQH